MAETDVVTSAVVAGLPENRAAVTDDNQPGASDWAKDFDEGLRKKVDKFKSPKDLATGYVELETYSSKTLQDMTPDQKEKFLKRLGLPEKPEEYELSNVTLPEGNTRPASAAAEFKAMMKTLNLTKDQGKGLDEWLMKRASDSIIAGRAAAKKQGEDNESALRASWGASFDANNTAVDRVIRLGGDKFVQRMNDGLGKDPVLREGFYAISKLMADETFVAGRADRTKAGSPPGFVFDVEKSPELMNR